MTVRKHPKIMTNIAIDNPNSKHKFNCFEQEDHVEMYKCHFGLNKLTRDYLCDIVVLGIEE